MEQREETDSIPESERRAMQAEASNLIRLVLEERKRLDPEAPDAVVLDAMPLEPPETERSGGPKLQQATVTELELVQLVASQFQVEPVWFAGLLENLGGKYQVSPDAMLAFFGVDGFTTMDEDWWAPLRKQAEMMKLDLGQLAAADAFRGVAITLGDRKEFNVLLAAGAGERDPGAFIITEGEMRRPSGHFPKATTHRLAEMAELLEVTTEEAMTCCQAACRIRQVDPDEIVAMGSNATLILLRLRFDQVLELAAENRNRRIATRCFDWLATQCQVRRFNWEALHLAAKVLEVDPGVALAACVFVCDVYEPMRAALELEGRQVPKPEGLLALLTEPLLVAAGQVVALGRTQGLPAPGRHEQAVFGWLAEQRSKGLF